MAGESRVVNREFVLGPEEKEEFVRLLRLYEEFCELRVVTYCIMSNHHFHVFVEARKVGVRNEPQQSLNSGHGVGVPSSPQPTKDCRVAM